MIDRKNISDGVPWEASFGYCRAVRIGNVVEVSGTAAANENGELVGEGDAYEQTRFIIEKIDMALRRAGAQLSDVVRTRIYVTDAELADDIGRAHSAAFGEIRPACTLVEVSRFISPGMLVEIEARAVIGD